MNRMLALACCLGIAACAADEKKEVANAANSPPGQPSNQPPSSDIDRSRCDSSGKKVVEFDLDGDKKADVWKYYATTVENGAKVDVLTCKEVDANHDGKKDWWTYY